MKLIDWLFPTKHYHDDWDKWEVFQHGQVVNSMKEDAIPVGSYVYQKRVCNSCGLTELAKQVLW